MTTYIALFRGINVGGKNSLPMKDLSEILADIGCESIKTYIQSGNVVFQHDEKAPDKLAERIKSAILDRFQFEPETLILTSRDLENAVRDNPFETGVGKVLHFFFMAFSPSDPDKDGLNDIKAVSEQFHLGKTVFYLYAPDGIGRSKLAAKAERLLGVPVTARNWNTVSKLMELVKQVK